MTRDIVLLGGNTSGRTDWMKRRLAAAGWPYTIYVGPYPERACTGLAWTVQQELRLSKQGANQAGRDQVPEHLFALDALRDRPLHELSGGESVRVCLAAALSLCASEIQVDVALEHLDAEWRSRMFQILKRHSDRTVTFVIADNRLNADERSAFGETIEFSKGRRAVSMTPLQAFEQTANPTPCSLVVDRLSFRYSSAGPDVLKDISLQLEPAQLYFLNGANGSGKSTLSKVLSGAVSTRRGQINFGQEIFRPGRSRSRFVAMAFQNPDYQWTSFSVSDELNYLLGARSNDPKHDRIMESYGIPSKLIDANPIELPFVFKKRLGLALAALSTKPWVILDEPCIGQDPEMRLKIAEFLKLQLQIGRGLIVIGHDPEFRAMFPAAKNLNLRDGKIHQSN